MIYNGKRIYYMHKGYLKMTSSQFSVLFCGFSDPNPKSPFFERRDYKVCTIEYVLSGKGFLEINGNSFEVGPDSVYILHKHSDHKYWHDETDPWEKIYFLCDGSLAEELISCYDLNGTYWIPGCESCKELFFSLYELRNRKRDLHELQLFHQLLSQLFQIHNRRNLGEETAASKLKCLLEESIQKDFLLKEYAEKSGFSEGHLIRSFHHEFGSTPHHYLQELRLQSAAQALIYSDHSVKEIAEQFCFSNQYHFSNVFKKKYHSAPQTFRKKNRL